MATIVLAVAAVAIAWSTYQSTQWRGEQAADNSKASAARIESSQSFTRAGQLTQIDVATFIQWVDADVAGDTALADFYRNRFRDEFEPAFDAWVATNPMTNVDVPPTPFAMKEYVLADTVESERLAAVADERSAAASEANEYSARYMLAVVLFATALFFASMSTKVRSVRQQEVLVALGGLIFVGTAIFVAISPIRLIA